MCCLEQARCLLRVLVTCREHVTSCRVDRHAQQPPPLVHLRGQGS